MLNWEKYSSTIFVLNTIKLNISKKSTVKKNWLDRYHYLDRYHSFHSLTKLLQVKVHTMCFFFHRFDQLRILISLMVFFESRYIKFNGVWMWYVVKVNLHIIITDMSWFVVRLQNRNSCCASLSVVWRVICLLHSTKFCQ